MTTMNAALVFTALLSCAAAFAPSGRTSAREFFFSHELPYCLLNQLIPTSTCFSPSNAGSNALSMEFAGGLVGNDVSWLRI
jgi:hypothetical protein